MNVDFADVRTVMADGGSALMGTGISTSDNRAVEAAQRAISGPLLETDVVAAKGNCSRIAGGDDLSLLEVTEAAEVVRQAANGDANIIFGATVDERLAGQMWVTVIATGIGGRSPTRSAGATLEPPSFLRGARASSGTPRRAGIPGHKRGAIAAGHPLTAGGRCGSRRRAGNAVDAGASRPASPPG